MSGPCIISCVMEGLVIVAVILGIGGVIFWSSVVQTKKRREGMRALAARLKFDFFEEANSAMTGSVGGFHLFKQGHSKKIRNVLSGTANDIDVRIFDYKYTTGSGKNQSTHKQSIVLFESQYLQLPLFELRPENVFHKIGTAFGYQDIDFDSHSGFSKHYLLRGDDEAAIRDLFSREVLDNYEHTRGLSTEGGKTRLVFYRAGKTASVDKIEGLMAEAFKVFALFKSTPRVSLQLSDMRTGQRA